MKLKPTNQTNQPVTTSFPLIGRVLLEESTRPHSLGLPNPTASHSPHRRRPWANLNSNSIRQQCHSSAATLVTFTISQVVLLLLLLLLLRRQHTIPKISSTDDHHHHRFSQPRKQKPHTWQKRPATCWYHNCFAYSFISATMAAEAAAEAALDGQIDEWFAAAVAPKQ